MRPDRGGGAVAAGLMPGAGAGGRPSLWRTPTPYLFLGVAAMMAVIVVALLVLLCTRRRGNPSSSSSSRQTEDAADGGGDKAASFGGVLVPLDREPCRVVVIMAGDRAPSFLASAKPLALATTGGGAAAADV